MLAGHPCPLAAGADVILGIAPGPEDADRAAVLGAHARLHPGVPLCVELRASADDAELPPTATVVASSSPEDELAEVVRVLPRRYPATCWWR